MQGTIAEVRDSQSGKTISVKVGNEWYTSKCWEFREMQGQMITFEPSLSEWNGKTMKWINEYAPSGMGPADQAMNQAMQNNPQPAQAPVQQAQPAKQESAIDRDASIVAQALTKSVSHTSAEEAWNTYTMLYTKYKSWGGVYRAPNMQTHPAIGDNDFAMQSENPAPQDFDDSDIPF